MLLALASSSVVAQSRKDSLTTKVVDVVKSYAPTIADADKKREDAKIKDSLTVKKKKINTFVKEMSKEATPKLNEDFKSKFTSDKNIIEKIIGTLK